MSFVFGIILFAGIIWYFGIFAEKKQTKKVRKQIVSGNKDFLVHWTYDPAINLAEFQDDNGGYRLYKNNLTYVKEVYICSDGILIGEDLFISWKRYSQFRDLRITTGEHPCVIFIIEYKVGQFDNVVKLLLPIPKGKELEAVSVLDRLVGTVKYDY
ncbi:MAG TPA: hypothetical protein VK190_08150 [Pseudoneobacillus sp.]|nr:hypothetical protein [Pseudoneobacillus sp.]